MKQMFCPNKSCIYYDVMPMHFLDKENIYKCSTCGFEIKVKASEEDTSTLEDSSQNITEAFEKAKNILNSGLARNINIKCTISGDWANRFQAARVLMIEGLNMSETAFTASIIKNGINSMVQVFTNLASSQTHLQKMVKDGIITQQTADNLVTDLKQVYQKDPDNNFDIKGDE